MEVTVDWTEDVVYRSTITLDEDEIRLWLADEDPAKVDKDHEITAEEVKDFLESGDEEVWFEQTDTSEDFQMVNDRNLDEVQL